MLHVSNRYFYINVYRFVDLKRNLSDFLNSGGQGVPSKQNDMYSSDHRLILRVHDMGVCPCLLPFVLLPCPTVRSLALCS